METKKKLRKDLDFLNKEMERLVESCYHLCGRVEALEAKIAAEEDIISGKVCAHMLGWNSDSIKSDYLKKLGIEFTLDEKGRQKISKKSVIAYLAKKEDQNQ